MASGLRDGRTGFDALPVADQQVLLANDEVVLVETDPHLFAPAMEHISTTELAAAQVPITWLLGTDTRSEWFSTLRAHAVRERRTFKATRLTGPGTGGRASGAEAPLIEVNPADGGRAHSRPRRRSRRLARPRHG